MGLRTTSELGSLLPRVATFPVNDGGRGESRWGHLVEGKGLRPSGLDPDDHGPDAVDECVVT